MRQELPQPVMILVVISCLLICATTILPAVYVLYIGLYNGTGGTAGIRNHIRVLNDPLFVQACTNTFFFSTVYACLQVSLAFIVAKSIIRCSRTVRYVFLNLLMGPWVISEMATVIMWRWIFFAETGPLDQLVSWIGFGYPRILIHTNGARIALLIAALWRGFAFSTIFAIGVLASIPRRLYQVSRIENLGWWRTVLALELPVIRPAALMMGVVLAIQTVSQFTLSARLTNGGPAHATTLVGNYIYDLLISESRPGPAAAAGSMVFIAVGIMVILLSRIRRHLQ